MKICSKCKEAKQLSEFSKDKNKKDGLGHYCKNCQKIYMAKYQKTAKGKISGCKRQKKYRKTAKGKANRKRYNQSEEGKAVNKRYRQSEKGKIIEKRYRQSEKGKTVRRENAKRFKFRHPNNIKAKHAVSNAICAGKLPRPDTKLCHYCPKPAEEYHHWHGYEPEHWFDIVPVCKDCHRKCKKKIA